MIRLSIPTISSWLELVDDVRVKVKPVTYVEQAAARAYATRLRGELAEGTAAVTAAGGAVGNLPDQADPDQVSALEDLYYAQGLARQIIEDWEGVLDEIGRPAPVTPQSIDQFIRLPYIGELFVRRVQVSLAEIFASGEDCAVEPPGGSAAAANTAEDAPSRDCPAPEESAVFPGTTVPS